jgi:hypothetical protein
MGLTMKLTGTILLGLATMAITHSQVLGMAIGLFALLAVERLDLNWLRK